MLASSHSVIWLLKIVQWTFCISALAARTLLQEPVYKAPTEKGPMTDVLTQCQRHKGQIRLSLKTPSWHILDLLF